MKNTVRGPFAALALSSLMIGTLHHWGWNIACTGILFGFAFAVGVKQPRPAWLWLTILAAGAPAAGLLMHAIPGLNPQGTLLNDFGGGALASLGAMIPGLGAGYMFRRLRRLRAQPSMIA
jgi:hypothetical protein